MLNLVMAPIAQKQFQSLPPISYFLPGPRNDMGLIFHQRKICNSSVIQHLAFDNPILYTYNQLCKKDSRLGYLEKIMHSTIEFLITS